VGGDNFGPGENASPACSTSISRIYDSDVTVNQGGGRILARFCRFNKSASQNGSGVGKGGFSGFVGPLKIVNRATHIGLLRRTYDFKSAC